MEYTDESIMPFGKFKGDKLEDVPAWHLLWLLDNDRAGRLKDYIIENEDVLRKELKES